MESANMGFFNCPETNASIYRPEANDDCIRCASCEEHFYSNELTQFEWIESTRKHGFEGPGYICDRCLEFGGLRSLQDSLVDADKEVDTKPYSDIGKVSFEQARQIAANIDREVAAARQARIDADTKARAIATATAETLIEELVGNLYILQDSIGGSTERAVGIRAGIAKAAQRLKSYHADKSVVRELVSEVLGGVK